MNPFACLEVIESAVALEVSWYDSDDTFYHFIYLKSSKGGTYVQSRKDFRTIVIAYWDWRDMEQNYNEIYNSDHCYIVEYVDFIEATFYDVEKGFKVTVSFDGNGIFKALTKKKTLTYEEFKKNISN